MRPTTARAIAHSEEQKAAEDSRTPRRWRDGSHATSSARSWSAAVLCRFELRLLAGGYLQPTEVPSYVGSLQVTPADTPGCDRGPTLRDRFSHRP
jgi:hypothetical protein